jgi:hypothetical protein
VQIGGGVRVSDAFQAIVEFEPIAIWVREFCIKISQGEAFAFHHRKREKYETGHRTGGKAKQVSGVGVKTGEASGVAAG